MSLEQAGAVLANSLSHGATHAEAFEDALLAFKGAADNGIRRMLLDLARRNRVSMEVLTSPLRHRSIVRVRDEAAWLMRNVKGLPFAEIGAQLGGRDHSSMMTGISRFEARMATDDVLAARMRRTVERMAA